MEYPGSGGWGKNLGKKTNCSKRSFFLDFVPGLDSVRLKACGALSGVGTRVGYIRDVRYQFTRIISISGCAEGSVNVYLLKY